MMDNFTLPEEDDEEIDIYAALGLNTPIEENQTGVNIYDPLAAFMDEDDDDDVVAHGMFVETASPFLRSVLKRSSPRSLVTCSTKKSFIRRLKVGEWTVKRQGRA